MKAPSNQLRFENCSKPGHRMTGRQATRDVQSVSFKIIQLHAPLMVLMNPQLLATQTHVVPMPTASQAGTPQTSGTFRSVLMSHQ